MTKVFGITGWKNSGKTTLVAALITEFTSRGFVVNSVKHAHKNFQIDHEGTDSHRHRTSGAQEVAIVSKNRWAVVHEVGVSQTAPDIEQMLSKMSTSDITIVEGFKGSTIPKIECIRAEAVKEDAIWRSSDSVVALATDHRIADCDLPQFSLDDVKDIADYIAQTTGLGR
ncbi:MAG: molybdopterin-guanine dinucleotide biosynthesis protein B [Pseudomonadota bacterium]